MWCLSSVGPFLLGAVAVGASDKILPAVGTAIGMIAAPVVKAVNTVKDAAQAEVEKD